MKEANIIDIERVALDFLLKTRKEQGLSETEFGKLAFPEASDPRTKIHAMWAAKSNSGNRLRLRLGDFCAMCLALGKNPAQELLLLWNQVEQE